MIGWREWVTLPQLGIARVKAKIDTGARTSSLHALNIEIETRDDRKWALFTVEPEQRSDTRAVRCSAPLVDRRHVTNSGGQSEKRPVIETTLQLGPHAWPIEITLTERADMRFRMLLGRHALRQRFSIDPGHSYLIGKRPPRPKS